MHSKTPKQNQKKLPALVACAVAGLYGADKIALDLGALRLSNGQVLGALMSWGPVSEWESEKACGKRVESVGKVCGKCRALSVAASYTHDTI